MLQGFFANIGRLFRLNIYGVSTRSGNTNRQRADKCQMLQGLNRSLFRQTIGIGFRHFTFANLTRFL